MTALAARADKLLTYGEMLFALAILVIFGRTARVTKASGLILLLLPWAYLVCRDAYEGNLVDRRQFAYPLVIIGIWALRPRVADLRILGYLVAATASLSLFMGFVVPSAGILRSADTAAVVQEDKQILGQGILLGPFNQGNQLGSYLVVGIAAVGCIASRRWRWLMVAACAYALLWSSSRSSLATLAAVAIAVILLDAVGRRARPALGVGLVAAVAVAACVTPLLTRDPEAFTNRGFIWTQVLKAWGSNPVFGLGTDWFAKTAASSDAFANSAYDAHNQFLQLLATGGIVLAALVGLLLLDVTAAAVALARRGNLFGLYFLIVVVGAGWLEASFGFVDRNQMTAVAILPMAFLLFAQDLASDPDDADRRDEHGEPRPTQPAEASA
jgi:O-antigen ligase